MLAAGQEPSVERAAALEYLCRSYWLPIYAFVRRGGRPPAESEDLTQGFFTMLLERQDFAKVRRAKGKFRTYLLAALKHFLVNQRERTRAIKRGGGKNVLSLSFDLAESQIAVQGADCVTPDQEFNRRWGLALLENVKDALRDEMQKKNKGEQYDMLLPHLLGDPDTDRYAATAERLGMTEAATKMATSRLRKRYGELIRSEIARTVPDETGIDDEIAALFKALRHRSP